MQGSCAHNPSAHVAANSPGSAAGPCAGVVDIATYRNILHVQLQEVSTQTLQIKADAASRKL